MLRAQATPLTLSTNFDDSYAILKLCRQFDCFEAEAGLNLLAKPDPCAAICFASNNDDVVLARIAISQLADQTPKIDFGNV